MIVRGNCIAALSVGGLVGYLASHNLPIAAFAAAVAVCWILWFCNEETA